MAVWIAAARRAANLSHCSSRFPYPSAWSRRRRRSQWTSKLKVNFWQDPMHPSRWKKEQFVIVSITGWGLLFYGGYKFFTEGKNDKKEEKVGKQSGLSASKIFTWLKICRMRIFVFLFFG